MDTATAYKIKYISDAGISHLVEYPKVEKATSKDKLIKYYRAIPTGKIELLYNTFKVDFDLFDYNIPDYLKH